MGRPSLDGSPVHSPHMAGYPGFPPQPWPVSPTHMGAYGMPHPSMMQQMPPGYAPAPPPISRDSTNQEEQQQQGGGVAAPPPQQYAPVPSPHMGMYAPMYPPPHMYPHMQHPGMLGFPMPGVRDSTASGVSAGVGENASPLDAPQMTMGRTPSTYMDAAYMHAMMVPRAMDGAPGGFAMPMYYPGMLPPHMAPAGVAAQPPGPDPYSPITATLSPTTMASTKDNQTTPSPTTGAGGDHVLADL